MPSLLMVLKLIKFSSLQLAGMIPSSGTVDFTLAGLLIDVVAWVAISTRRKERSARGEPRRNQIPRVQLSDSFGAC